MNTLIEIFCELDDFCITLKNHCKNKFLKESLANKVSANMLCSSKNLHISEVMTIITYFHNSGYRTFKKYYTEYVGKILKSYFPNRVSYNRFVELKKEALIPLIIYSKNATKGKCSGISFIDSTPLEVCKNKRIPSHKVFKDIAQRGKSSMGWFYGFKLHLTVNDKGDILGFYITPGNTDDRNSNMIDKITSELKGKLFGDRGYISKKLSEKLYLCKLIAYFLD